MAGTNRIKFTVEFDSTVWDSLNATEKQGWVDRVADLINDEAYVSEIEVES